MRGRPSNQVVDWTPEQVATLRRLWGLGNTASEIARVLACSKNSVIGKANRLHLTPRPSPIKGVQAKKRKRHQAAIDAYNKAAGLDD